jgi:uncharacterized protein (DUF58 family)
MSEKYSAGDVVEVTVTAEVVCTYRDSDRVKLRWHSNEEIMHESDARLQ